MVSLSMSKLKELKETSFAGAVWHSLADETEIAPPTKQPSLIAKAS